MKLKQALTDHVFVRRVDPDKEIHYTHRGSDLIILPKPKEKDVHEGIVHAVGPGWVDKFNVFHPTTVKVGDRVLFTGEATTEVEVEGVKMLEMHEGFIILVLESEPDDGPVKRFQAAQAAAE
jgi:co-chaperonin GroES (HSP10)